MTSSNVDLTEVVAPIGLEIGPPSNQRPWKMEQAVLPYAELGDREVTVRNVRQCRWNSESDRAIQHAEWTFKWDDLEGVDFVVVPFQTIPVISHTMLSFRMTDGRALVVSVEARLERGEVYSPTAGAARQFELMYVLGDEPDLFGLRANVRGDDVFLYSTNASPQQAANLLREILKRTNDLARSPEYYDSFANNCTTNILDHVLELRAGDAQRLKMLDQVRSRFPANSDRMAYDLGLIKTDLPFEEARKEAWISSRIKQHLGDPKFTQEIRKR